MFERFWVVPQNVVELCCWTSIYCYIRVLHIRWHCHCYDWTNTFKHFMLFDVLFFILLSLENGFMTLCFMLKPVLLCHFSYNLSCNFVAIQVAREMHGLSYPAIIKSRNNFVAASVAPSRIKFYFPQQLRQRCNVILKHCTV